MQTPERALRLTRFATYQEFVARNLPLRDYPFGSEWSDTETK
jgi:hypothetical protein